MVEFNQVIIKDKIISFLKKKGRASSSEISKNIKHNRLTVTKYLEIMKAHNLIGVEEVAQAKLWFLSDKLNKKKILVVDDEPHIVQLVKLSLLSDKNEIIEAYSGFDALEKVRLFNPDIIILDLMMPGLSGFDVCRKLKSEARFQHIPIVILSAKNELEDKMKGINLGADDYLTKPFDPIELEARIDSILSSYDEEIEFNHLSNLPGKTALLSFLNDNINNKYYVYVINIQGLKLFNRKNGFKKGNEFLILLSRLISEQIDRDDDSRAYHLINDLFVIVTKQKDFIESIKESYGRLLPFFYSDISKNIKDNIKLKINLKLINKSMFFKDINRLYKKIQNEDLNEKR
jgi:two-component system, OmpR family, alkaline phosphatase synthesis response regulator PhoP